MQLNVYGKRMLCVSSEIMYISLSSGRLCIIDPFVSLSFVVINYQQPVGSRIHSCTTPAIGIWLVTIKVPPLCTQSITRQPVTFI